MNPTSPEGPTEPDLVVFEGRQAIEFQYVCEKLEITQIHLAALQALYKESESELSTLKTERDALLAELTDILVSQYVDQRGTPEERKVWQCARCGVEATSADTLHHKPDCILRKDTPSSRVVGNGDQE